MPQEGITDSPPGDVSSSTSEPEPHAKWSFLFHFTTRRHIVLLIFALFFTVARGLAIPLLALILGRVFNELSRFGAGSISATHLMNSISLDCLYLLGIGLATLVLNSIYFLLWVTFGELQAKNAREELFGELLGKDTQWFDGVYDGLAALLPRIQA